MPRLAVPLRGIEIFGEAGRTGSFKQAASNLALTTSAISQAVRKLEENLGCSLFRREGNSLHLTREGETLLAHVELGLEQIRRRIDAAKAAKSDQLSITAPPGIAKQLLGPLFRELVTSTDVHDLRFMVDETPDFRSFRDFDIAVIYGEQAATIPNLISLGPDVFAPVCHPSLRERLKRPDDIRQMPLIVNETNAVKWSDWATLNKVVLRDVKWLRLNRLAQVLPVVLTGNSIACESLRMLAPQLTSGELVLCDIPGTSPVKRDLTFMYVNARAEPSAKIRDVAARIRAACFTNEEGLIYQPLVIP